MNLIIEENIFPLPWETRKKLIAMCYFKSKVKGGHADHRLVFALGPLATEGWSGSDYFERINAGTSKLINLDELFGYDNFSISKIVIVAQGHSVPKPLVFRIRMKE